MKVKDIKAYFGDCGIEYNKKYVLRIWSDDFNIYWIPNGNYKDTYFSSGFVDTEKRFRYTVLWVSRKDMCAEIQNEFLISQHEVDCLISKPRTTELSIADRCRNNVEIEY